MPKLDGTGPAGMGPLTGRGAGNCNSSNCIYYGTGRGRGLRCRQLQSIEENKQDLQEIKNQLESELKIVKEKLDKISE